jgi:glycine betaine/proline transport system substrate-binding protein
MPNFDINKKIGLILSLLLMLIFSSGTANADKSGVVKIPTHNWSSQLVGAKIIGELMKMVGERVKYIPMDSQKVYQSMADGDIDLVHEIWEIVFGVSYEAAKQNGNIEEILTYDAIGRYGWWYPKYVEKICPGLPDWEALNKCSEKFARDGSEGKGVFIAGPVDWSKKDLERVEALKMNFIVKHAASANEIWSELDLAVNQNKPIVIFTWIPNFIGAKHEGKFVDFPKYETECNTDPSWGINPNALYDCDHLANGYLKLAVNKDFEKNHPKGYKLIKQINFSISDFNKMGYYIDAENLEAPVAAKKWLLENKPRWSKWVNN